MRPSTDDIKINGMTRTNDLSVLTHRQKDFSTDLGTVFSFFFPSLFFGFAKPVTAITNLAHLLLPCGQANAHAKSKELNFPTHKIGVLCTFFARALDVPKSAPQACGIFICIFCFITTFLFGTTFQNYRFKDLSFSNFEPININNSKTVNYNSSYINASTSPMGGTAEDIIKQTNIQAAIQMGSPLPLIPPSDPNLAHQFILQQAQQSNQSKQASQLAMLHNLLSEDSLKNKLYSRDNSFNSNSSKMDYNDPSANAKEKRYENAFDSLKKMLDNKDYNFKKASFIPEKAYNPSLNYQAYNNSIKQIAKMCKQMANTQPDFKKDPSKVLSWAVMHYMVDKLPHIQNGKMVEFQNYRYDFEDPFGEKDIRQLFVTKLLKTGKGNCHSLPYLYKSVSQELGTGANAHLAYAPNHVFIRQKFDNLWWNCELTSGQFIQDYEMMAIGYIQTEGVQGKIYMTPLTEEESVAACVMDLAQYYEAEQGLDNFVLKCTQLALEHYPNCIQANLVRANYWNLSLRYNMSKKGVTKDDEITNDEYLSFLASQLKGTITEMESKGYVNIPEWKYNEWVKSMQQAGQQETEKLKKLTKPK
jgi:hypothetical protein